MVSKSLIKNELLSGCDPATAVDRVNQQLCERNSSQMFVTVWLAVLDISTGKGLACNAGHEHPALRRTGGDFELVKYRHGMFVGISKKAKYQNREFTLQPGDSIFVYTDGVPEATDENEKQYGTERMINVLNAVKDEPQEGILKTMRQDLFAYMDKVDQFDDITMLGLKYTP